MDSCSSILVEKPGGGEQAVHRHRCTACGHLEDEVQDRAAGELYETGAQLTRRRRAELARAASSRR